MARKLVLAMLLCGLVLALNAAGQDAKRPPEQDPLSLKVLAPNGGEKWDIGSTQAISWALKSPNPPDSIQIFLTNKSAAITPNKQGDAAPVQPVAQSTLLATLYKSDPGKWDWTEVKPVGKAMKIEVKAFLAGKKLTDASDASFAIFKPEPAHLQPAITITSPNGKESWLVGSSQVISWKFDNAPELTPSTAQFAVRLSRDGGKTYRELLAENLPLTVREFKVPNVLVPASDQCRVKVLLTGLDNGKYEDISDADFQIKDGVERPASEEQQK
jgi:hypothetical protein